MRALLKRIFCIPAFLVLLFSGCRSAAPSLPPLRHQTIVPRIDAALVKEKLMEQKEYLLRIEDPKYHGFYKKYDALKDKGGTQLRTIYTASSLLTLLKINDYAPDSRIYD